MPRRYNKRKPRYPRLSLANEISTAQKALSVALSVKKLINVEFKNHDVSGTTVSVTVAPIIVPLTNIAQGDTTITRDGASLKVMSLRCSYSLNANASAQNTLVRVMIVIDRQTNEAIYTGGDLLLDVTSGDNIVSPRNLNNNTRFKVLYDRVHAFTELGVSSNHRLFYKKLNLKLRFDNAAGAITSLTQSSMSFVFMSNQSTNTPTITHANRIRFIDN